MPHSYEVLASEELYSGRVISLRRDTVAMPGGGDSVREVVRHPGAVGVVALDDEDRVVLLRQYRHPVGQYLWELPAGLRDAAGEPPLETARRELAEEALLSAQRWSLLATPYSTPGFCDEKVLVYLAEGLTDAPRPDGFTVEHEELDMTLERVPLADAVQMVFSGEVRNALAVIGLLAAAQVRAGSPRLRPVEAE
ncbi:NUDIX domain-containing protein [Modestobacter sp. I12A-02628]|uniref:NUDIX hydrolase n=1 Tax=Goekera deserti TaxID=2497753 RepID=A0A7K3WEJ9_9ACTN|nr:NUDIX hydrolase [Goekera deserti]MPQ99748.1 NUDIX domain-containing protein [Goekera deserti]NDI46241.1 NUDIX domain-containing protein [Goekera deserti]NEL54827.1 NUDIX hydrolase [Goekera deserti]